jgi:copper(I)-binding protein
MKTIAFLAACLLLLPSCSDPASNEPVLVFEDAWVRVMPPGSMMTAGFGQLVNRGHSEIHLSAYSSPQFADVSLHQSLTENGVSRMQAVGDLSLSAGEKLELAPGGYHLMLMRPAQENFTSVQIHIDLADGKRFSFDLALERR